VGYRAIEELQELVNGYDFGRQSLQILEAGCGSLSHFNFPGSDHRIVGIDISPEQLDKNKNINEKILGDIERYPLEQDRFDLIVSWEVFEHLDDPALALENLAQALRPGGLLIIAAPNPVSMKGIVTRITPHIFHIWVYRYIFNKANAGLPGYAPFPTTYRKSMFPDSLQRFARSRNFDVPLFRTYDVFPRVFRERRPIWMGLYRTCATLLHWISGGKLGGFDNTEFLIVLRKPNSTHR
jgi:SAM-dependent methyltransferase